MRDQRLSAAGINQRQSLDLQKVITALAGVVMANIPRARAAAAQLLEQVAQETGEQPKHDFAGFFALMSIAARELNGRDHGLSEDEAWYLAVLLVVIGAPKPTPDQFGLSDLPPWQATGDYSSCRSRSAILDCLVQGGADFPAEVELDTVLAIAGKVREFLRAGDPVPGSGSSALATVANVRAMDILLREPHFASQSSTEWAKRLCIDPGRVRHLPAWRARRAAPGVPRRAPEWTVPATEGNVLDELIEEQEAEARAEAKGRIRSQRI